MARKRTDAERRLRQTERLGRLLRVLRLVMGSGRLDCEALATELECSVRTVQRLLQTLTFAGVPVFFDEKLRAYRVRPGFKFPALDPISTRSVPLNSKQALYLAARARKMLEDGEQFLESLRTFCEAANQVGAD